MPQFDQGLRVLMQLAKLLLFTWAATAAQVSTAAMSALCASFLEQEAPSITERLRTATDFQAAGAAYCAAAGLAETPPDLTERDSALLDDIGAGELPYTQSDLADVSVVPPRLGFPLHRHVIPGFELFSDLAPLWVVETDGGGRALLDSGSDATVIAHPEAERLGLTHYRGVYGVQSIHTDRSDYWLGDTGFMVHRGVRSADIELGLLGRDVLNSFGAVCADWTHSTLRFGPCLRDRIRTITARIVATSDGSPLVALRADGEDLMALVDTGTNLSIYSTHNCPNPSNPSVPVDTLSVAPRMTGSEEASVLSLDFELGDPPMPANEWFICEASARSAPAAILGMSFLSRFSAVEFDQAAGSVTFFAIDREASD